MRPLDDTAIKHLRTVLTTPDFSGTRYEIENEAGRGGMGTVYLARDRQLDRRVALKVLSADVSTLGAAERLLAEAKILARLEHPGIVPVHDAGTLPDGRVYYAMKYVEGVRLDAYKSSGPALADALRLFLRITETVAFAHAQGVIHRDLKPENIMVGRFGEVLVMDWGIAKLRGAPADVTAPLTDPGAAIGTAGYMAPEQGGGRDIDERADVYALGQTLRFLASGPGGANRPLAAIISKATRARPGDRYASVADLQTDVAHFLDGLAVAAYRENLWERGARLAGRNKTAIAVVAAYLVMRAVVLIWTGR